LFAPIPEERVVADQKRAGLPLDESVEGSVDLAFGSGLQDRKLHPFHAGRFLRLADDALGTRIVRIHEQPDCSGLGNQLRKQLQALSR
jgi:hypothetical protein